MKKLALLSIAALFAISACKKDDHIFDKSPDERVNESLKGYKQKLTESAHGWKAFLFPKEGGGYTFMMKFNAEGNVSMTMDFSDASLYNPEESTYRLRALEAPALVFDTYSPYIHLLSNPDNFESPSAYETDFEFIFKESKGDTIKLIGVHYKNELLLVKANQEDDNKLKKTHEVFGNMNGITTYFKDLDVDGQKYQITYSTTLPRNINFSYIENSQVKTFSTGYYFNENGLQLVEPFNTGKSAIAGLNFTEFDPTTQIVSLITNSGKAGTIKGGTAPLQYDLNTAKEFYNNPSNGSYWISTGGFTIDGVADAYNVQSIPGFNFLLFWPKYNPAYSRLGYIVNGGWASYGPAPIAKFTEDGLISFTSAGSFGTPPATIKPIVDKVTAKWIDPSGYYVIKTGNKTYDLVSAKDARTWISFE
ncbi:DUF4302 domain-containing protein [Solitalea canadensis]|uniref:DUF4302 domain-containing protein n=1 Tax=Solitalea canadensis (strain ATCC 29591 / DSM 3403 / JCM 21819 / LMG 8368 / NBRC 15130 / NCIMB 12057 / USAM 9D) TaxID=929556 RepID=H8KWF9_SOLCM|nr:DUF4302 domain-containing protein [Solitalea canadensis]AFD08077.1 hypothetical protein Solca_3060 [Solitalea canadensis DSM 3403]